MCYLCSVLFNVDKNAQRLLTLLTKLQGCYIYGTSLYTNLFIFKIGKFFKS